MPAHSIGIVCQLVLAFLVALGLAACQSSAVVAFEGARYYAAGSKSLERGESQRAVDELEHAAALIPHASEIQNHLGLAYLSNGQRDRARRAFESAVELDCENVAAQTNLLRLTRDPEASASESADMSTTVRMGASIEPAGASEAGEIERSESHGG